MSHRDTRGNLSCLARRSGSEARAAATAELTRPVQTRWGCRERAPCPTGSPSQLPTSEGPLHTRRPRAGRQSGSPPPSNPSPLSRHKHPIPGDPSTAHGGQRVLELTASVARLGANTLSPKGGSRGFPSVALPPADSHRTAAVTGRRPGGGPRPPTAAHEAPGPRSHRSSLAREARRLWPATPAGGLDSTSVPRATLSGRVLDLSRVGSPEAVGSSSPLPRDFFPEECSECKRRRLWDDLRCLWGKKSPRELRRCF